VQQVVLSTLLVGVAMTYFVIGRDPWKAFVISGGVSIVFLAASLAMWKRSNWVGVLSLTVLFVAMFWDEARPASGIAGAILAMLSAWMTYSQERNPEPETESSDEPQGEIVIQ
jgi:hypothetical protein